MKKPIGDPAENAPFRHAGGGDGDGRDDDHEQDQDGSGPDHDDHSGNDGQDQ